MATPYILDLLSNLKAKVATNETNIATNKTNIAANKKSIDDHKADDTRHWTTADRTNFDRVVHFKGYFTTEAALIAAHPTGQLGDYAIVGETDTVWLWDDTKNKWLNSTEQGIVISVNNRTGEVVLTKTDVGLSNVDNTADNKKPVSEAQQEALDNKADRNQISESEADGFTLRAGIYYLLGEKTILGTTTQEWTIIVGEYPDMNSSEPATQLWITFNNTSDNKQHIYMRHRINNNGSSWSDFKELATNTDISSLKTQITTNKNNIKTNADDIDVLDDNKADRKVTTLSDVDGFDLSSGIYCIKGEQRTILGHTSQCWIVNVGSSLYENSMKNEYTATQVWMPYYTHADMTKNIPKIFIRRQLSDGSNGRLWSDYSELITSDKLTNKDIENINHYKGYYATAAALVAAYPTGVNGDYAIVGENQVMYIWNSTKNSWTSIINDASLGSGSVTSVNGATGAVVLTKSDIGLTNVDNTKDADKNVKTATTLKTARNIDGVSFNGSASISHFGVCSTDGATAAKVVSCTGFTLVTGARITVKFSNTNTVASATLNVNNTGAKVMTYNNMSLPINTLLANEIYEFIYDGTSYCLVGAMRVGSTELASNGTLIRYNSTTNKIEFVIANTVVGTLSNTGVFNCNELTENTGTTIT